SWSQFGYSGLCCVSIRSRRWSYSLSTSRTWQPYSSGDHLSGRGRRAASAAASDTRQKVAFPRIIAGMLSRANELVSRPHSGQGRSSTHVQSFASGTIVITQNASSPLGRRSRAGPRQSLIRRQLFLILRILRDGLGLRL